MGVSMASNVHEIEAHFSLTHCLDKTHVYCDEENLFSQI